jgi:pilus assembly protein TadC
MDVFEAIGRLLFSRAQVKQIESQLNAAGSSLSGEGFLGFLSLIVFIIAVFATAIVYSDPVSSKAIKDVIASHVDIPMWMLVIVSFIFAIFITATALFVVLQAVLVLSIEARRRAVESVLPDFLTLTAANLKAGMTLDQAMWYAATPEFGLLSIEVKKAIKRAFSGESLESALDSLAKRFDSRIFTRTIVLIKQASATGGEVAKVLESTADDARNTLILKKEIAASLIVYEIFVLFAASVGTPFLFAVAGKMIEVFEKQKIVFPSSANGLPSFFGAGITSLKAVEPLITSSEFFYFSLAVIFATAVFSSLIISVIRTGKKDEGIKYFPFIFGLACVIYAIVSSFLASVFTTLT